MNSHLRNQCPRSVFFGTPTFACPALRVLNEISCLTTVVTQPDRPRGRSQDVLPSPVKQLANELCIPVMQPDRPRGNQFITALAALEPDVLVVVAYGHILPAELLALRPKRFVNLHASLLPRWRGASPIQHALMAGDRETGVSLMVLDEGMDTGPVIASQASSIDACTCADELAGALAESGAALLRKHLLPFLAGELQPVAQPTAGVSYAPKLTKDDGQVRWIWSSRRIYDHFRAMGQWPGLHTQIKGKRLRLIDVKPIDSLSGEASHHSPAGTITRATSEGIVVACGTGALTIRKLQIEGRKATAAGPFVAGHSCLEGTRLGAPT